MVKNENKWKCHFYANTLKSQNLNMLNTEANDYYTNLCQELWCVIGEIFNSGIVFYRMSNGSQHFISAPMVYTSWTYFTNCFDILLAFHSVLH